MQNFLNNGVKKFVYVTVCLLNVVSLTAYGASIQGVTFSHKDWEVACDNTGSCRVAGYAPEGADSAFNLSVLFTRAAGANEPVHGKLSLESWEQGDVAKRNLELRIGEKNYGKINVMDQVADLTPQQVEALLNAAKTDQVITFFDVDSEEDGILSGEGMSAVLLKMDEFQGRVGTTGAIIRKGKKPQANVLAPQPVPVLVVPKVLQEGSPAFNEQRQYYLAQEEKLMALIQASYDEACSIEEEAPELEVYPLNHEQALLSRSCWIGAYNMGDAYWLVDRNLASAQLITTDATDHEQGQISGVQKGRGLGDCLGGESYTWDGTQFIVTSSYDTGFCRGQLGGFWMLPTIVYDVDNGANVKP